MLQVESARPVWDCKCKAIKEQVYLWKCILFLCSCYQILSLCLLQWTKVSTHTLLVIRSNINPLTPSHYFTKWLPYAEGDWEVAPKQKVFFFFFFSLSSFQKITARFVFKIKSSFFSPFLVIGWILVCNVQKCSKIILSYIQYMLCDIENENFHTFTYKCSCTPNG